MHEEEVAKLCNDPQNETLTPAHVDTILQHVVLFHKRPLLLLSAVNSVEFDNNLRSRFIHPGLPAATWKEQVIAAVPQLRDDRLFGNIARFETFVVPIYVPGHFVSGGLHFSYVCLVVGAWYLRRIGGSHTLLRQPAEPQRLHQRHVKGVPADDGQATSAEAQSCPSEDQVRTPRRLNIRKAD